MTATSTSESSAKSSAEVNERIHAQERSQPVARARHSVLSVVLIRSYQRLLHGLALVLPFRRSQLLIAAGCSRDLAGLLQRKGWRRPLLVTDQRLMQLQLPHPLIADLNRIGLHGSVFDQVPENPTLSSVEAGLRFYRAAGCDSLIAFGGGSVIDCAKGIGARVGNPWLPLRWMEGLFRVLLPPPPLACVPTTAGSGSEASIAAVFTDPERRRKIAIGDLKLLPQVTVIDPELMRGLPPTVTAAGGLDALTHAVESFIGRNGSAFSERKALSALSRIARWLPLAYQQGDDLEARLQMALAAHEAGEAFTRTNVGYAHAIAHALGCEYGIPHGLANAIALPKVLDWSLPACETKLALLARSIDLGAAGDSESSLAVQFIRWIEALNQELGVPAGVVQLHRDDIPRISCNVLKEAHPAYPVPRLMTPADCEALLCRFLVGTD